MKRTLIYKLVLTSLIVGLITIIIVIGNSTINLTFLRGIRTAIISVLVALIVFSLFDLFYKRNQINRISDSNMSFEEIDETLNLIIKKTFFKATILSASYALMLNDVKRGNNEDAYERLVSTNWKSLSKYTYYFLFLLEIEKGNIDNAKEYEKLLLRLNSAVYDQQKQIAVKLLNLVNGIDEDVSILETSIYPVTKQIIEKYKSNN